MLPEAQPVAIKPGKEFTGSSSSQRLHFTLSSRY